MAEKIALVVLLLIHGSMCFLWFRFGKTPKKDVLVLLPLVVCLPIIGLAGALIVSRRIDEVLETPVDKLYRRVENEALSVTKGKAELETVVPFDEVLLLSNDQTRREVMMHILRRDPFQYLEMLKAAKVSSDVEVTHYATATIMEIQRDLDITMQKAEEAFRSNPDDIDAANRFISALSSYINTGLLLENRMLQLRYQLSEILEHKLSLFPKSRSAHLQLVDNEINLGNYTHAAEVAADMRDKWPADEKSWLTGLHVCMAAGDAAGKTNIANMLAEAPINWSKAGREEANFLCGF